MQGKRGQDMLSVLQFLVFIFLYLCVRVQHFLLGLEWFFFMLLTAPQLNGDCQFTDYLTIAEAYIEDEEDIPTTIFCGSKFPEAVYSECPSSVLLISPHNTPSQQNATPHTHTEPWLHHTPSLHLVTVLLHIPTTITPGCTTNIPPHLPIPYNCRCTAPKP